MNDPESWRGIPADRIVAVLARLDSGRIQVGSGYLLTSNSVITARHCGMDKKTCRPAVGLQVIRLSDGFPSAAEITAACLDIAVLTISAAVPGVLPLPQFGRVDTTHSAELAGCEAVGFPLWQLEPRDHRRNAAEIHGTIRTTEGAEDGLLVLRDPLLSDVQVPDSVSGEDRVSSAWGGLSGALVFHAGVALGVVTEHYPQRGGSALTLLPIQRLAALARAGDRDAANVAAALGLPAGGELPVVGTAAGGPGRPGRKRLILAVAAVDGEDGRSAWIAVETLRAAGISPEHCERQDDADGSRLIILPAGLDPAFALPAVLRAARLASDHVNAGSAGRSARLLLAAGCGTIQVAASGYVGPGISQAQAMAGADGRRRSRREAGGADLVAMLSDQLYLDICERNPGGVQPARFHAVSLPVPGTRHTSRCWVHVPERPANAGFDGAFSGRPRSGSQSLSLDIIPLAGMGTALWWSQRSQDHPHGQASGDHESPDSSAQATRDAVHDQDGIPGDDYDPGGSPGDDPVLVDDRFDVPGADEDDYHDLSVDDFTGEDFTGDDGAGDSSDYGDASGW